MYMYIQTRIKTATNKIEEDHPSTNDDHTIGRQYRRDTIQQQLLLRVPSSPDYRKQHPRLLHPPRPRSIFKQVSLLYARSNVLQHATA